MTLLKEGTMTTDSPIEAVPGEWQTPAARRFLAADNAVTEALAAVAAADARLEAARAAEATESTVAGRSELTRARRQRTAASDQLIAAEEALTKASRALDADSHNQDEPDDAAEVSALQQRIRAALSAAALVTGLYGRLNAVASRSGLSQIGPAHADALGRFAEAARALSFQQGQAGWRLASDHREVTR